MRRNLFLYLTLACFFGLIVIFIVDGYMGIYGTLEITAREEAETIEPDFWLRQDGVRSIEVNWEEKLNFRYKVENRQFSSYAADIEVSVWRMGEKVFDVTSRTSAVAPFGEGHFEWTIDNTELLPDGLPPEQDYDFTVIIKRGEIERKVIVHISQCTSSA